MLWHAVLNRLILFIRFCFTILLSEPFLQVVRGDGCPRLPMLFGSNVLRDGRS
jgi:hypothetical protein